MPAYQAGLRAGDRVVAVDGEAVSTWEQMRILINSRPDEALTIDFERKGQRLSAASARHRWTRRPASRTGDRHHAAVGGGRCRAGAHDRPQPDMGDGSRDGRVRAARHLAGRRCGRSRPVTTADRRDSVRGAPGVLLIASLIPIAPWCWYPGRSILDGGHACSSWSRTARSPISMKAQVAFQRVVSSSPVPRRLRLVNTLRGVER
jgi:hypothetical protein